ncbi:TPA: hypothetical protein NWA32_004170 [Escherichia coli]|nr:hypothetical protein [Escherichia coli]
MDKFLAGAPVTLTIPLQDRLGNTVAALGVEFEVLDRAGAVKQARQAVTVSGNSVEVTVTSATNELADGVPRDLRTVKLYCQIDGGEQTISRSYAVEAEAILIVGVNSFQTLEEAELTAMDIFDMGDWDVMDDDDKIRALIDARTRICGMTFNLLDLYRPQDNVSYVPEGVIGISKGVSPWNIKNQLGDITIEQYNLLPEKFKQALRLAQVADAAATLSPDPVEQKRAKGLILDTIGETKQMFSSGRPVSSPVAKKAMDYLRDFVVTGSALKIGRT